jgi:hypothetical protein
VQEQAGEIEQLKAEIERLNKVERDRFDFWATELLNLHPGITKSLHGHKCHHPIMNENNTRHE